MMTFGVSCAAAILSGYSEDHMEMSEDIIRQKGMATVRGVGTEWVYVHKTVGVCGVCVPVFVCLFVCILFGVWFVWEFCCCVCLFVCLFFLPEGLMLCYSHILTKKRISFMADPCAQMCY